MWSGPRSLSTALMRAWENRPDTVVADEPLYAFYLARTGAGHPDREAVLASQSSDWREVVTALTLGPVPGAAAIYYGKHMTHHLLPEVDRASLAPLRHAYLIRDPASVLASYSKVRAAPTLDDLGLRQQVEIYAAFPGPVVDSHDLLADPEGILRALCAALGVPFRPEMLSWPPGPRDSDGVWAPHWYQAVWASTGFGAAGAGPAPARQAMPPPGEPGRPVAPHLAALARQCRPFYEHLHARRLAPMRPQAPPDSPGGSHPAGRLRPGPGTPSPA